MKLSILATAMAYSLSIALVGCSSLPNNMPLVFGEDISVGISMGASTTSQGGELTLGFKSKDIAIIPVVATSGANTTLIQSELPNESGHPERDAYSVLGQFGTTTDSAGRRIGLGKFFATGTAARQLATGFGQALARDEIDELAASTPQAAKSEVKQQSKK